MTATLTLACGRTDRTEALFTGEVKPRGVELAPLALQPGILFPRVLRRAEFDVAELSASSYMVQLARGESQYVALPVFLSRSFRFDAIYVRDDRGIEQPLDLAGRRIGTPEFQMTAGVWVRGILQDHYGLDPRNVSFLTGGLHAPGRPERIRIDTGPDLKIEPIGEGETLDALLREGAIDAIIAPQPPACFSDGSAPVRRLFRDAKAEERAFFGRTGVFPIMHLVAVRRELVDASPGLADALFEAFAEARNAGYRRLDAMAKAPSLPLMLPWIAADIAESRRVMGADPWPYGLAANRETLAALCRYSFEQRLSARLLDPEELFAEPLRST